MKKKNLLFTALTTMLSVSFALAQYTIQWQKSLGGTSDDNGAFIQQTNDGGFIAVGSSNSNDGDVSGNHGGLDYWVVKLNDTATIEWQKSLGGTDEEIAFAAQQTNDGGYIVAGVSRSNDGDVSGNHGNADFWVVKLSNIGTIEWQKSLGGSGLEGANAIQQTNDGGYIVAGYSNLNDGDVSGNHGEDDFWVVKLSSIGTIEWQKSLGGSGSDGGHSIQQTNDGGYIVAGSSKSNDGDVLGNHGLNDFWVVKISSIGLIEWQESIGGSANDIPTAINQTNDGGYIVAGWTSSNDGDVSGYNGGLNDCWVVKLNNTGTIEWQNSLGGSGADYANYIQQTNDGGYIVACRSTSIDGDVTGNQGTNDYWIVKLTSIGTIEWQKSLGGSMNDLTSVIDQTNDGEYIVTGNSISNDGDITDNQGGYDLWVVKLIDCELVASPQLVLGDTCITTPLTVQLDETLGLQSVQWNMGDPNGGASNLSTSTSHSHQYSQPGTFTISAIVDYGCGSDTITRDVQTTAVTEPLLSFAYANDPCRMNNTSPELPAGFASGGTFSVSPALPINSANGTLELLEDTEGEFIVTYSYAGGNCIASSSFSDTIAIRTFSENLVTFIPSIFSPNDKGPQSNEKFCVLSDCVAQFKLVIYNRWGQQVFETEDINQCWDGTFNGVDASSGAYAYNVYLRHLDTTVLSKTGTLVLVK